jgi:hypothetical protein
MLINTTNLCNRLQKSILYTENYQVHYTNKAEQNLMRSIWVVFIIFVSKSIYKN